MGCDRVDSYKSAPSFAALEVSQIFITPNLQTKIMQKQEVLLFTIT